MKIRSYTRYQVRITYAFMITKLMNLCTVIVEAGVEECQTGSLILVKKRAILMVGEQAARCIQLWLPYPS